MSLAVVADPDLRERVRCIRIIARQTSVGAVGAATWAELEQAFEDESGVGLLFYTQSLPGAPDDALELLLSRTHRLVLAVPNGQAVPAPSGVTQSTRPIPEETLITMARATSNPSTPARVSFMPVDFIQMICMSGDSQVLVLGQNGSDSGVIEIRNGEVWTAFDSLGVGEEAFARLIRPEMRARISNKGSTRDRTIFKGLHELVLESLRRIDEGKVLLAPTLAAAAIDAALSAPADLAERVRELNAEVRLLLMQRNYDDAARALMRLSELDPSSHLVRANLQQLRRLGYPK